MASRPVIQAIVTAAGQPGGILEIGPGPGVITRPLAELGAPLTFVELDERMAPLLQSWVPGATPVWGDVLAVDLAAILAPLPEPRVVVSNMPYNITGPLLQAITNQRGLWVKAVLMMQAEVAEKILAPAGDRTRGALSVVLQSLFAIRQVAKAPGGAFMPPPKVDSIVLEFLPLAADRGPKEQALFERVVRAGFISPRKTLANNLVSGAIVRRDQVEVVLGELAPQIRPHQLTLAEWEIMSHRVAQLSGQS